MIRHNIAREGMLAVLSPSKEGVLHSKRRIHRFVVIAGFFLLILMNGFSIMEVERIRNKMTTARKTLAVVDESQRILFIKEKKEEDRPATKVPTFDNRFKNGEDESLSKRTAPNLTHATKKAFSKTKAAANLAVFYNAYLPSSTNDTTRQVILDTIFASQLAFLGNSYAVVNRTSTNNTMGAGDVVEIEPVKLYYNTIDFPLNDTWMKETCAPYQLEPVHMRHYKQAFEEVTLNALHEYCIEHPDHDVIYLHPKGSFHPKESQKYWRKEGTMTAASEDCATKLSSSKCNGCGARFNPMPTHFSGNFWRSKCNYVRFLRNVTEVEPLFRQTYNTASSIMNMSFTLSNENEPFLGLDRFAAEQWIGSSPAFQPCNHELYRPRRKSWQDIKDDPVARRREYFLLPGLLLRYATIYNDTAFPPYNSWIYDDFPDGEDYREAVRSHGSLTGAVHQMMMTG